MTIVSKLEKLETRIERLETLEFPDNNLLVQNQGATLPGQFFREMDFIGSGVLASIDPINVLKALVTIAGGGKGSITGCDVVRVGYNLGTSTYWEIEFNNEIWDPDGMFNVGVDPNRIQIISQGYWLVVSMVFVTSNTALTGDVNKIETINGNILIYDGAAIDDEWDFMGPSLFATQGGPVFSEKVEGDMTMFGIYRHNGTNSDPWVGGEILVARDPVAGWGTLPDLDIDVFFTVVKLGDLEA